MPAAGQPPPPPPPLSPQPRCSPELMEASELPRPITAPNLLPPQSPPALMPAGLERASHRRPATPAGVHAALAGRGVTASQPSLGVSRPGTGAKSRSSSRPPSAWATASRPGTRPATATRSSPPLKSSPPPKSDRFYVRREGVTLD
eukprot:Transcript_9981.p3 GENE.Transcript_9981~~Transcript_9981.p3  ORF type:complete len:146 (+),score=14.23 Transcript_9981:34-471(+)